MLTCSFNLQGFSILKPLSSDMVWTTLVKMVTSAVLTSTTTLGSQEWMSSTHTMGWKYRLPPRDVALRLLKVDLIMLTSFSSLRDSSGKVEMLEMW